MFYHVLLLALTMVADSRMTEEDFEETGYRAQERRARLCYPWARV